MKTHTIHGGWGHHIEFTNNSKEQRDDGTYMRVYGHLPRHPEVDDNLTCPMQSGKTAKFVFTKIEPCNEPTDMFFADVRFDRYLEDGETLPSDPDPSDYF